MSTIQNFGVPLGNGAGRGGMLQPKTKQKFRVIASSFGIASGSIALTQQVMSCGRPSANFNPIAVHSYNSTAYYAGKVEWQPIQLTVRDDVTNSVSALVGAQLQKQLNFFQQTSPIAASNYFFLLSIQTMDGGDDVVLEEWVLENCQIASANYESFDYSSGDAMTIQMDIRYDNATQSGGLMPLNPQLDGGFTI